VHTKPPPPPPPPPKPEKPENLKGDYPLLDPYFKYPTDIKYTPKEMADTKAAFTSVKDKPGRILPPLPPGIDGLGPVLKRMTLERRAIDAVFQIPEDQHYNRREMFHMFN
jgi:hypothetical protein